jgi:hypothetical protein
MNSVRMSKFWFMNLGFILSTIMLLYWQGEEPYLGRKNTSGFITRAYFYFLSLQLYYTERFIQEHIFY